MKRDTQLMEDAISTAPQPAKRRGRPPKRAVVKTSVEAGVAVNSDKIPSIIHSRDEHNDLVNPQPVKRRARPPKNTAPKTSVETGGDTVADEVSASVHPRNKLNDLTAREWIPETISVWNQRGLGAGHPDAQIERQHPAPFSFTDVGRLIRFFTKKGHIVLDPFVGVGSTLKACAIDGRHGIGIELNPDFAELSRKRLATEVHDIYSTVDDQCILEGDARDQLPTIADESVDFVVTSPPYWSILKKEDHKVRQERLEKGLAKDYGTDARDLAKIEHYDDFLRELVAIFGECARVLKRGRYMAIIVSDFRDKSKYIMFHADLARALVPYSLEMRGLKVLYQRHKKVFPYGYPYSYVPNIHNQYILILQKSK